MFTNIDLYILIMVLLHQLKSKFSLIRINNHTNLDGLVNLLHLKFLQIDLDGLWKVLAK